MVEGKVPDMDADFFLGESRCLSTLLTYPIQRSDETQLISMVMAPQLRSSPNVLQMVSFHRCNGYT